MDCPACGYSLECYVGYLGGLKIFFTTCDECGWQMISERIV